MSVILRITMALQAQTIEHDDAISLLSATGNQVAYNEDIDNLAGRWLRSRDIKKYTSLDETLVFSRIKNDLVAADIHPPLYFWLLHVWLLILGVAKSSGPLLNLLIFFGTSVILYKSSLLVTSSKKLALAATAIFCASPVTIDISLWTRQYELYMLLSLAVFMLGLRFLYKDQNLRVVHYVLLAIILLAGMLTQYYFLVSSISIFMLVWFEERRLNSKRMLSFMAVSSASALAFFFTMHEVFEQLRRQQTQAQEFSMGEVPGRIVQVVSTLLHYVGWNSLWPRSAVVILFALFVVAMVRYIYISRTSGERRRFHLKYEKALWFFLVFNLLVIALLYVLQFSPKHAMDSRYIAAVAPLIAILIVTTVRRITRFHSEILAAFGVFLIASSTHAYYSKEQYSDTVGLIRSAEKIVVDNLARGFLLPRAMNFPEDAQVFVAWRNELVDKPLLWVDELKDGSVVIMQDQYRNSNVDPVLLTNIIDEKYKTNKADYNFGGSILEISGKKHLNSAVAR